MKRPSPYQASILIRLRDQDGIISTYHPAIGPMVSKFVRGEAPSSGELRARSIQALINNSWIYISDRIETNDRHHSRNPRSYFEISPAGLAAIDGYTPPEVKAKVSDKIISGKMLNALKNKYALDEWAFIEEVSVSTGYTPQRIDGYAINCWPMNKYRTIAFEIKASRGDFLSEIKKPAKRLQGMAISNQFYFVAPWGMIKKDEIPEDCGLLEYRDPSDLITTKRAPITDADPPSWWLLASIARRYAREHAAKHKLWPGQSGSNAAKNEYIKNSGKN